MNAILDTWQNKQARKSVTREQDRGSKIWAEICWWTGEMWSS